MLSRIGGRRERGIIFWGVDGRYKEEKRNGNRIWGQEECNQREDIGRKSKGEGYLLCVYRSGVYGEAGGSLVEL